MEGTRVKTPARLAVVVRSFLGSRLERELLTQVFGLAARGPAAIGAKAPSETVSQRSVATRSPVRRKGA